MKNKRMLFLILIIVVASIPLLFDKILLGHDLIYHIGRIDGISKIIPTGQFPIHLDFTKANGWGYISPTMYPELFLYFPAFLNLCGVSLFNSYKVLILAINIAATGIAYYSFNKITNDKKIAMMATLFYVLSPYRLTDVYYRSALGETLALTFLPLFLLGLKNLFYDNKISIKHLVIAACCIFQSHIVSTEMCLFIVVLVCLINIKKIFVKERFIACLKAIFLCIMLNLWYIIPFFDSLLTLPLKLSSKYDVASRALNVVDLFRLGKVDYLFLSYGLVLLILSFVAFCFVFKEKNKMIKHIFFIGVFFTITTTNLFPWSYLQSFPENSIVYAIVSNVQFPWRLLGLSLLCLSVSVPYLLMNNYKQKTGYIVIAMLVLLNAVMIDLDEISIRNVGEDLEEVNFTYHFNDEFLFKDIDFWDLGHRSDEEANIILTNEELQVVEFNRNQDEIELVFESTSFNNYIELPLFAYKGWQIELDGVNHNSRTGVGTDYRIYVDLNGVESGKLFVYYKGRNLYRMGELLSVLTIILICVKMKRDKKTEKEMTNCG